MVRHKPKGNETMTNEPTQSLYVETLLATSRAFEWNVNTNSEYGELSSDDFGSELWRAVAAENTIDALDEYDSDWREKTVKAAFEALVIDATVTAESDDDENLAELAEDHFDEYETAIDQFRDSFHPAMNFVWPLDSVDNARHSEQDLADMVAQAGCCVLVQIGDEYGIALTGGGMDLSDHIVRAYVNCGYMPPLRLIENAYSWGQLAEAERTNVASRAKSFLSAQIGRIDQNANA